MGGREALDTGSRLRPDVVVLARSLPDGNGFEVLEEIGAADPDVRVVVMSVDWDALAVRRAFARGAAARPRPRIPRRGPRRRRSRT